MAFACKLKGEEQQKDGDGNNPDVFDIDNEEFRLQVRGKDLKAVTE